MACDMQLEGQGRHVVVRFDVANGKETNHLTVNEHPYNGG